MNKNLTSLVYLVHCSLCWVPLRFAAFCHSESIDFIFLCCLLSICRRFLTGFSPCKLSRCGSGLWSAAFSINSPNFPDGFCTLLISYAWWYMYGPSRWACVMVSPFPLYCCRCCSHSNSSPRIQSAVTRLKKPWSGRILREKIKRSTHHNWSTSYIRQ